MSWNEIVSDLLKSNAVYDNWKLSIFENKTSISTPEIIKLTLKLLERALEKGINKIIIVYPDRIYLPPLTVVFQAVSDIISGKLIADNNYHSLIPGQKIKIDNFICEFDGIRTIKNKEYFCVQIKGIGNHCYPLEKAPFFQKTDTKRSLSRYRGSLIRKDDLYSVFDNLESKKSFLSKSIYFVTSANKFSDILGDIKFFDNNIYDLLLLGKIKSDNTVDIINKDQISGNPALLFSSDLYSLLNQSIENVRCIFIDNIYCNFNNQLDAIDILIRKNVPIVFLSDTINSFDNINLEERGFITLRWDKESLIPLINNQPVDDVINSKIINCCNKIIKYIECENKEITEILQILNKIRYVIKNTNQNLIDVYWQIYNIAIFILRNTIDISISLRQIILKQLDIIKNNLQKQFYNISLEDKDNLAHVLSVLETTLNETYQLEKTEKAKQLVSSSVFINVIIVIPDNDEKNVHISYWNNLLNESSIKKNILIMYSTEYSNSLQVYDAEIIVCGWLGKNKMKNIIFGNNVSSITILLYKIEEKWKKYHLAEWEKIIKNESRRNFDKLFTSIEFQSNETTENNDVEINDDIDTVEISIQENRYKKYSLNTGNMTAETIPITFVSGYFSFYKKSSDIITVTDIINNTSDSSKANIKNTTDIQAGDFIVIRETERSLIRELADAILIKEGKREYREMSGRWKNKLNEKRRFCSIKDLYEKIISEGANIGIQAFRAWVEDDDFIAPQDKENLLYISVALNDNYLIDNIDKIWEVCKYVRTAHVKAGNEVSKRLKNGIAKAISEIPKIRRNDIWDPIDLQLDELGKVKILKVTSIGDPVFVDIIYTNRLLTESPRDK